MIGGLHGPYRVRLRRVVIKRPVLEGEAGPLAHTMHAVGEAQSAGLPIQVPAEFRCRDGDNVGDANNKHTHCCVVHFSDNNGADFRSLQYQRPVDPLRNR